MLGEAAALLAAACWAIGSHLFGRIGKTGTSPIAMNLGKCVTGVALFAATSLLATGRLVPPMDARSAEWLAVSGVVGLALGDASYFAAMFSLGVRRALLLLSTAPVWTAIGGALWLDERLNLRDALSILAVMAGVGFVVYEKRDATEKPASALGILFGLGAGLGQAGGSLLSRRVMTSGVTALDAALVRLAAGTIGIFVLAALSGRLVEHLRSLRAPRLFRAIAGTAFLGTFCGIWLAQYAIGHAASTAVATTLLATSPVFALPLGRLFDREPVTARAVVGTLIACVGLSALTLARA